MDQKGKVGHIGLGVDVRVFAVSLPLRHPFPVVTFAWLWFVSRKSALPSACPSLTFSEPQAGGLEQSLSLTKKPDLVELEKGLREINGFVGADLPSLEHARSFTACDQGWPLLSRPV